jgi:hypothetical protein
MGLQEYFGGGRRWWMDGDGSRAWVRRVVEKMHRVMSEV